MKAIHNELHYVQTFLDVGNYKLKYNFESNSQLIMFNHEVSICW
ncbi:TPA: hypothetical protein ACGFUY_002431 [Flavobacterium psychrophilum]